MTCTTISVRIRSPGREGCSVQKKTPTPTPSHPGQSRLLSGAEPGSPCVESQACTCNIQTEGRDRTVPPAGVARPVRLCHPSRRPRLGGRGDLVWKVVAGGLGAERTSPAIFRNGAHHNRQPVSDSCRNIGTGIPTAAGRTSWAVFR